MEFIAKDSGNSSIQITSLKVRLNGKDIKNFDSFCKKYEDDIEIIKNKLSPNFKIFIIMDTDDCSEEEKIIIKIKICLKNIGLMIIYALYITTAI